MNIVASYFAGCLLGNYASPPFVVISSSGQNSATDKLLFRYGYIYMFRLRNAK
jgi:hypothetical protein